MANMVDLIINNSTFNKLTCIGKGSIFNILENDR